MKLFLTLLFILSYSLFADVDPAIAIFRDNCSACHLDTGHGNLSLKVPSIAGLPRWYVSDQIRKFRNGQRGGHKSDTTGHLMKASTMNLKERDIAFLGRFIQKLKPEFVKSSMKGDLDKGKALYQKNCTSCHEENGEGNKSKRVPPLNVQLDWYLLAQIEKFGNGQRAHTKDSLKLKLNKKDATDIVLYLSKLKFKK
jgi:cytochrome c553